MTSLEWGPPGSRALQELEIFLQEIGDEHRRSTIGTIRAALTSSLDPLGHPDATVRQVAICRAPGLAVQDVLTAVPVFEHPQGTGTWVVVIYAELGTKAIMLGLFRGQVPENPGTVQIEDSDWDIARKRWEDLE